MGQLLHANEMEAELTRITFDYLMFIAQTEQLEAFQLQL